MSGVMLLSVAQSPANGSASHGRTSVEEMA